MGRRTTTTLRGSNLAAGRARFSAISQWFHDGPGGCEYRSVPRSGARTLRSVAGSRRHPDRHPTRLQRRTGRAEDQERRNHTAQYVSHPAFTSFRLRQRTPSRYESYVDSLPAEWIHVRIEVDRDKARLYVHGTEQPTLIVNDLKSGSTATGAVALWFEGSTIAHFANLKITTR